MDRKNSKQKNLLIVLIILLVIILSVTIYLFLNKKPQEKEEETGEPQIEIILKEDLGDGSTEIYFHDLESDEKEFFMSIPNLYAEHYHPYEYHNENLYVIRRSGDIEKEDWTDELWRYDKDAEGERLYTAKGIDFRVSKDESIIAIKNYNKLTLLSKNSEILKEFANDEILNSTSANNEKDLYFLDISPNTIWLQIMDSNSFNNLVKIEIENLTTEIYDLSNLDIRAEYSFNKDSELLAFSDYPVLYDVDSSEQLSSSNEEITLYLYDINTEELEKITTSTAKMFEPIWIDKESLEYNNPDSTDRIIYKL